MNNEYTLTEGTECMEGFAEPIQCSCAVIKKAEESIQTGDDLAFEGRKKEMRRYYEEAILLLEKLANECNARAQYLLGDVYRFKAEWLPCDSTLKRRILDLYTAAAKQGMPEALIRCAEVKMCGDELDDVEGGLDSATKAARKLRPLAEKGDADAQYYLSQCYLIGYSECGENESLKWCWSAANQGHREAEYGMGCNCDEGCDMLPCDKDAAVRWWQKAARQGHLESRRELRARKVSW